MNCNICKWVKAACYVYVILTGIVGVILMFYGGLHLYDVSYDNARRDGLADIYLRGYINCREFADSQQASTGQSSDGLSEYMDIVYDQCVASKASITVIISISSFTSLLSLIIGSIGWIRPGKWEIYSYAIWASVALSSTLVSFMMMLNNTLVLSKIFRSCEGLDSVTITRLESEISPILLPRLFCITGPTAKIDPNLTAQDWLKTLNLFWVGLAATLFMLTTLTLIKAWEYQYHNHNPITLISKSSSVNNNINDNINNDHGSIIAINNSDTSLTRIHPNPNSININSTAPDPSPNENDFNKKKEKEELNDEARTPKKRNKKNNSNNVNVNETNNNSLTQNLL